MERKAATFTSYNANLADNINEWLDEGWQVEHIVSAPVGSYMRVLIIFVREQGVEE